MASNMTAKTFHDDWVGFMWPEFMNQWCQLYPATNISNDGTYIYFIHLDDTGGGVLTGYVVRALTSDPSVYEVLSTDNLYVDAATNLDNSFPVHNTSLPHPGLWIEAQGVEGAYYFMVWEDITASTDVMARIGRYDVEDDSYLWSDRLVTYVSGIDTPNLSMAYDAEDDVLLVVQFEGVANSNQVELIKVNATDLTVDDSLAMTAPPSYTTHALSRNGCVVVNPDLHHAIFTQLDNVTIVDLDDFTITSVITGETDPDPEKDVVWYYRDAVASGDFLWVETKWLGTDTTTLPDYRKYEWDGTDYLYVSTPWDSLATGWGWPALNYHPGEDLVAFATSTNGDDYASPTEMALWLVDPTTDAVTYDVSFATWRDNYGNSFSMIYSPAGDMYVVEYPLPDPTGCNDLWTVNLDVAAGSFINVFVTT